MIESPMTREQALTNALRTCGTPLAHLAAHHVIERIGKLGFVIVPIANEAGIEAAYEATLAVECEAGSFRDCMKSELRAAISAYLRSTLANQ